MCIRDRVCSDLKVLCILLCLQQGLIKVPYDLCEWDSRETETHWKQKEWPKITNLTPGQKKVFRATLLDAKKMLLLPLHIKLSFTKEFVKVLDKVADCFKYLCTCLLYTSRCV